MQKTKGTVLNLELENLVLRPNRATSELLQGLGEKMCGRREALRERLGPYGIHDLI